jgi:hypothetical protein
MIKISGVWSATQFQSITSPQNINKLPSTNMHTTLKQYPGFDLPQTMRGMTSNLEVEMLLMLGIMKMPPYAKEESVAMMAVISLRRQWKISPFGGGRRVPPPSLPQKNMGKLGRIFSLETKVSIKRRRRDDARRPNEP